MRQLVYKVYFTKNQAPLYLWQIKPIAKYATVSLYYFPSVAWRIVFPSFRFHVQIFEKIIKRETVYLRRHIQCFQQISRRRCNCCITNNDNTPLKYVFQLKSKLAFKFCQKSDGFSGQISAILMIILPSHWKFSVLFAVYNKSHVQKQHKFNDKFTRFSGFYMDVVCSSCKVFTL